MVDATTHTPEQAAAAAEYDNLLKDPEAAAARRSGYAPERAAARQRLQDAASRAWPGEYVVGRDVTDDDPTQPAPAPTTRAEAAVELQRQYGSVWESKVEPARNFLRAALGEAFDVVDQAVGNDLATIEEVIGLTQGPMGTKETAGWVREYLKQGVCDFDSAEFARGNLILQRRISSRK